MVKRTKVLATMMAALITVSSLVGCGSKAKEADVASTNTLKVWSHLTTAEVEAIKPIAEQWGKDNNVDVQLVEDKGDFQAYAQAANSSKGPDIYFGLAHDNLGTFNKVGLLAEVPTDLLNKSDYVSSDVFDAVTINGKQIAVPLAQESIALFYNKDKISKIPETMEELVELSKSVGFKFNINDFYISYGFIGAQGGYIFGGEAGNLNSDDIGMDNEGGIKGYEFLNSLVKNGLISSEIDSESAKASFASGEAAFYISGGWDVSELQKSGVNIGISIIPTLGGQGISTFLGVQSAFVSEKSQNKDLAFQLLQYLCNNEEVSQIMMDKGNRLPILKSIAESENFKSNEIMANFAEQAKSAKPMPNIPEMQSVWGPGEQNIKLMLIGQLTPEEAAKNTVNEIRENIEFNN